MFNFLLVLIYQINQDIIGQKDHENKTMFKWLCWSYESIRFSCSVVGLIFVLLLQVAELGSDHGTLCSSLNLQTTTVPAYLLSDKFWVGGFKFSIPPAGATGSEICCGRRWASLVAITGEGMCRGRFLVTAPLAENGEFSADEEGRANLI
jgi:hypothetical protein